MNKVVLFPKVSKRYLQYIFFQGFCISGDLPLVNGLDKKRGRTARFPPLSLCGIYGSNLVTLMKQIRCIVITYVQFRLHNGSIDRKSMSNKRD